MSRDFAAYLQNDLKLEKGARVALMSPNILAFPVAMLGILRAGCIQVNANPFYTAQELHHQLNDADADAIVIFAGSSKTLADVMDQTPVRHVVIATGQDTADSDGPTAPVDPRLSGAVTLSQALEAGRTSEFTPPVLTGDDAIFLQYTGGTTGPSKGAILTNRNLVANTEQVKAMMPGSLNPGQELIVTALPMYHVFALMLNLITFASAGAENHLVADPRNLNQVIDVFRNCRVTATTGVNTLWAGLAAQPAFAECDFSALHSAFSGGSALHRPTAERWYEVAGNVINHGFGMSETSPCIATNPFNDDIFTTNSGIPMPSTEVILLDGEDSIVPPGGRGEVCIRGPQVMKGYWNLPDATAEVFTKDGFFRSGDIGEFDDRGFLSIVDRKKDMVIVSGFNVYPAEIEAHVAKLDGIVDCAVVGIPDEKTGETVALFVSVRPDVTLTLDEIRAHCKLGLTAYKQPKQINILDALPKSTVGKILRRELRDSAQA